MTLHASIAVRLGRGGNNREHPMAAHRRAKAEQEFAFWALHEALKRAPMPRPPLRVTMTRCGPGNGLDDDNLAGSTKHIRDGIAAWLKVNDNDPRVQWVPAQRKEKQWACEIDIEEVRDAEG